MKYALIGTIDLERLERSIARGTVYDAVLPVMPSALQLMLLKWSMSAFSLLLPVTSSELEDALGEAFMNMPEFTISFIE